MSQASTFTSTNPTGTPDLQAPNACYPYSNPTLQNVTGLKGQVCQVNWPPWIIDITSCCGNNTVPRVQDDCTQYCVYDGPYDDFIDCVKGTLNDTAEQSRTTPYCYVLEADALGANVTGNGNQTATESAAAASGTETGDGKLTLPVLPSIASANVHSGCQNHIACKVWSSGPHCWNDFR